MHRGHCTEEPIVGTWAAVVWYLPPRIKGSMGLHLYGELFYHGRSIGNQTHSPSYAEMWLLGIRFCIDHGTGAKNNEGIWTLGGSSSMRNNFELDAG